MKQSLVLLFAFFSFGFTALAQNPLYYSINIGTFIDAKKDDFKAIHHLGFMYSYNMENNYAQVFLGGYETRDAATAALAKVHAAGYSAAFIQERFENEGQTVPVVQIATVDTRKPIDWKRYANVADLWGISSGQTLKLATGPYPNLEQARKAQAQAQKQGYKDAFIRNINSLYLIKLGPFETSNEIKQPLIQFKWTGEQPAPTVSNPPAGTEKRPEGYDNPPAPAPTPWQTTSTVPSPGMQQPKTPYPTVPAEYNAPPAALPVSAMPTISIRSNIKRRSALELQKILKAENYYTGILDGYYGAGTAQGYLTALQNNRELRKYQLLAQHTPAGSSSTFADPLQSAINRLPDDARAAIILESYAHPVSYAYQAYQLFRTLGPGNEVNQLMNTAIRTAYAGKSNRLIAPFDYNATYAYTDLNQLILHLHYIHAAPESTYSVPCWLSRQHPQEAARAQAALAGFNASKIILQPCDPFLDWEEVRMLDLLSADIGGQQPSAQKQSEAASARALLSAANRPMSAVAQRETENWHNALLTGLNTWAGKDPVHLNKVNAFKVLYYQSQIRLEDYFMDKGFGSEEARFFATATLRTIAGPSLERFQ